ncbi:MAG: 50S ribosomal protein L11 methyltransferase [SAR324 cluster bacterium]|nr:50S ribosomal protein L11 methyltransferase [SAR324 cluster bacterium]
MMTSDTYIELWVSVPCSLEDLWSSFCFEHGASGIETLEETQDAIRMKVFFENMDSSRIEPLTQIFHKQYPHLSLVTQIKLEKKEYENWKDSWHEHFKPIEIGKTLLVCPPWDIPVKTSRHLVVIDPGQGFGTGYHPSTMLALMVLEYLLEHEPGPLKTLADVGVGSGILSIAACRLGILQADGVDIDPVAIPDVYKNAELNGLTSRIQAFAGSCEKLQKSYDVVISNMLMHELVSVKAEMARLTDRQGYLICSGLLTSQAETFCQLMTTYGMKLHYSQIQGEWTAQVFVKTA